MVGCIDVDGRAAEVEGAINDEEKEYKNEEQEQSGHLPG
jgi:hypothetical protein